MDLTDAEQARAERAILSSAEAYRLVQEAKDQRERADRAEQALSQIDLLAALGVGALGASGISLDYLYRIGGEAERALAASRSAAPPQVDQEGS